MKKIAWIFAIKCLFIWIFSCHFEHLQKNFRLCFISKCFQNVLYAILLNFFLISGAFDIKYLGYVFKFYCFQNLQHKNFQSVFSIKPFWTFKIKNLLFLVSFLPLQTFTIKIFKLCFWILSCHLEHSLFLSLICK